MVCVRAARSAPWYDADCCEAKIRTHRLEKLYRSTNLSADRPIHKRQVLQRKLTEYWISSTDSCKRNALLFWRKVRILMSPPAQRDTLNHLADDFVVHFSSKIEKIRTATESVLVPAIVIHSTSATPLSNFRPIDAAEIIRLLLLTLYSSSVLQWCCTTFSLMCNASLWSGQFSDSHKHAVVFPRLIKNHHSILTIWTLIDQYRTTVSFRSSSKSLHVNLSIMQNAVNCCRSSRLPIDSSTVLSLLS